MAVRFTDKKPEQHGISLENVGPALTMFADTYEELAALWVQLGISLSGAVKAGDNICVSLVLPNDVIYGSFMSAEDYEMYGNVAGLIFGTDLMSRAFFPESEK